MYGFLQQFLGTVSETLNADYTLLGLLEAIRILSGVFGDCCPIVHNATHCNYDIMYNPEYWMMWQAVRTQGVLS